MHKHQFSETTLANLKPAIRKLDESLRTDVSYWYRGEGGQTITHHYWGKPMWLEGFLQGRFDEDQMHTIIHYRSDHKKMKKLHMNEIFIDGYQTIGETIENKWSQRARIHFKTGEPFKV